MKFLEWKCSPCGFFLLLSPSIFPLLILALVRLISLSISPPTIYQSLSNPKIDHINLIIEAIFLIQASFFLLWPITASGGRKYFLPNVVVSRLHFSVQEVLERRKKIDYWRVELKKSLPWIGTCQHVGLSCGERDVEDEGSPDLHQQLGDWLRELKHSTLGELHGVGWLTSSGDFLPVGHVFNSCLLDFYLLCTVYSRDTNRRD